MAGIRLLLWDEPEMRRDEAEAVLGEAPANGALDLEAVYLWLDGRCRADETAEAYLFLTVAPGEEQAIAKRVTEIRRHGFAVHALPAGADASPSALRRAMGAVIDAMAADASLAEVIVAGSDALGLTDRLAKLREQGSSLATVGFRELGGTLGEQAGMHTIDVESIPGAYAAPLLRTNLFDLPVGGRTLPPLARPRRDGRPTPPPPPPSTASPAIIDLDEAGRDTPSSEGSRTAPPPPPAPVGAPPLLQAPTGAGEPPRPPAPPAQEFRPGRTPPPAR